MDEQIIELNKWEKFSHWCPAQMFYYFQDNDGGRWCIYLRWDGQRGDEPWQAELCKCTVDWDFSRHFNPIDLLKEKEHVPGVVHGYYYDEEYPFLQEKVLEMMKDRFPGLEFPNQ